MSGVYRVWGPVYRRLGYEPRPFALGGKACKLKGWGNPMTDAAFAASLETHGHCGIGLLTGTRLVDGSHLVALDIDYDAYVRLGWALMRDPVCARKGKKGVVICCRAVRLLGSESFKLPTALRSEFGNPAEILAMKKLVVIPPTTHPDTNAPYQWIGKPLHEVGPAQLPLIEV